MARHLKTVRHLVCAEEAIKYAAVHTSAFVDRQHQAQRDHPAARRVMVDRTFLLFARSRIGMPRGAMTSVRRLCEECPEPN